MESKAMAAANPTSLLAQAKRGNVEAIAAALQYVLEPDGFLTIAEVKVDC